MKTLVTVLVSVACVLLALGQAYATPVTFSNEGAFLAATGPLDLESFEGQTATNTRTLTSLTLADFTLTPASGYHLGVFTGPFFGGHATEGDNYVGFEDGITTATYAFDYAIYAYGINIIDFGDFGSGSLTFANNVGDTYTAAITGGPDGNEQFFGIIADFAFTNVTLTNNIWGEFYAVDEIYYGNPVPEPASMLLLGSGLIGLAGFRRRFRKQ